jgi:hypothetical protein
MLAMFSSGDEQQTMQWHFPSLFLLELLRAMWTQIAITVTAVLFVFGSMLATNQRPVAAALALSFGVAFAVLVGWSLNWYLGLAPLFCLRNGVRAREALEQALDFSSVHGGRLLLIGLTFFVVRLFWAAALSFVFLAPLNLAGKANGRWIALLMALVAVVYCAGADWLRLAQWGAYISLLEDSSSLVEPDPVPPEPVSPPDLLPLEGLA